MKTRMHWVGALALAMGCFGGAAAAQAQNEPSLNRGSDEPFVVVSVAGVDKLLGDVSYLTESAGAGDVGRMAVLMAGPYTVGIDRAKPWGVLVFPEGVDFRALAFVPVTDLDRVLATFREQIGAPEDVGEGVLKLATPEPSFVKESGGYAFIAQKAEDFKSLPMNPADLLGGLDKKYTLAARVNLKAFPAELKEIAISEMRASMERELEGGAGDLGPDEAEVVRTMAKRSVDQMEQLFNESEHLTIGLAVDGTARNFHLDVNFTAQAGTKLARQMNMLSDTKSGFAGFLLDDAAVNMNLSGKLMPEDIEQFSSLLKAGRARAMEELDKDAELSDADRAVAKEAAGTVLDLLQKTVESGKLDGGAAVLLGEEQLTMVAGGHVAGAKDLEATFRKLVDVAREKDPNFDKVEVKFNAEKHGDVTFHVLTGPVDEPEAARVLGEKADIVLGLGTDSLYVAIGNKGIETLKQVIDKSAADAGKSVPPMQLNVALAPILKFAAAQGDDPVVAALAAISERFADNDKVKFVEESVPNGVNIRVEIEEGVLKLIGETVKLMQGAGGAAPGGFEGF